MPQQQQAKQRIRPLAGAAWHSTGYGLPRRHPAGFVRYADALRHETLGYVLARCARQCGIGETMPPGWRVCIVQQKEEEALMTRELDLEIVNRALGETVRKLQQDLADADRRIRRLREELAEAHRAAALAAGRDW